MTLAWTILVSLSIFWGLLGGIAWVVHHIDAPDRKGARDGRWIPHHP